MNQADRDSKSRSIQEALSVTAPTTFCSIAMTASEIAMMMCYIGVEVRKVVKQAEPTFWILSAAQRSGEYGPAWLRAHPGRRLPGSMRNRRLAKKRAQYLERWAREVGLA